MMKKRLLLSIFVASLFVTFVWGLNSCKKNTEEDAVPTEVTQLRGQGHYAVCAHCNKKLWDYIYYYVEYHEGEHYPIDSVFHIHEYQYGDTCALTLHGGYCRYDGKHHRHEVYYLVDTISGKDHYQDDWIHIGGGGGGE